MAKVVPLRGQTPGGWSRERWVWLRMVTADSRLLPMPRLLATVLAQGYANHETAECSPGFAALSKALGASRATVYRALADLEAVGWIARIGGHGPGKAATIAFRFPSEQVSPVRPEQVSPVRPEQVSPVNTTGLMEASPPTPPYKDKPNMNQNARGKTAGLTPRQLLRGKPRPTVLSQLVQCDGPAAEDWAVWFKHEGFPPLERIGRKVGDGFLTGWDLPFTRPPRADEEIPTRIARQFAEWLKSRA